MKWIALLLSLVIVVVSIVWHGYIEIKPTKNDVVMNVVPGEVIVIGLDDYFSGYISTHDLNIDNPNLEVSKQHLHYEIKIPSKLRGYRFNVTLRARNLLAESSVSIAVSTDFIGPVKSIALANNSACITDEYGLFCWGADFDGQSTSLPYDLTSDAQLYSGGSHFCALENDRLVCWGALSIDIKLRNLTKISSGPGGVCYVDMDRLHCHAIRSMRLISDNIPFEKERIIDLSVGKSHACLMNFDRKIKCWGENYYKQIDVPESLIYPKKVISGDDYSCVLDVEKIRCWGRGDFEYNQPELQTIEDIAANGSRLCARDRDGWHCWDVAMIYDKRYKFKHYNHNSSVSISSYGVCFVSEHAPSCDGMQFGMPFSVEDPSSLAQSGDSVCFIDGGKIKCIGFLTHYLEKFENITATRSAKKFEFFYPRGNGCATFSDGEFACIGSIAVEGVKLIGATSFDVHNSVCASSDNRVSCWGRDANRKLSSPPDTAQIDKIRVAGTSDTLFACVLADSEVECWGDDNSGQSNAPNIVDVIDFDIFAEAGCLATKKHLQCWGEPRHLPEKYANDFKDISSVVVQDRTICVNDNGRVRCWGGRRNDRVPSWIHGVKELSTGMHHSCAIDSGGISCWGDSYFRLGFSNL